MAVGFAFLPMVFYLSIAPHHVEHGFLSGIVRYLLAVCSCFFIPVFGLFRLTQVFQISEALRTLVLVSLMLAWSVFVAWLYIQMSKEFRGENEPEYESDPTRAKYDWVGFRVRFVCGFIVGFGAGWRLVEETNDWAEMFGAMTAVGVFMGLVFGLSRPNFWSRS